MDSIENRWDILYRDFPEVYDEFAKIPKYPPLSEHLANLFDFKGKNVLDVGAGTGLSCFEIAPFCGSIIGVEPEDSMRNIAEKNAVDYKNARFLKGAADEVPLPENSVDISMAITLAIYDPDEIRRYVKEQFRVVKNGGLIIKVDIAPKWYGGELAPVILGKKRTTDVDTEGTVDKILRNEFLFNHTDLFQNQDYGSLDKIIQTYGFIFGRNTIDYLKRENKTTIKWKSRIYFKHIVKE